MKRILVLLLAGTMIGCGNARHVVVDPGTTASLASADWKIKGEPTKAELPVSE